MATPPAPTTITFPTGTTDDLSSIASITIVFDNALMNSACSDVISDHTTIIADATHLAPDVVNCIRDAILDLWTTNATRTTNVTRLAALVNSCPLIWINAAGHIRRIRGTQALTVFRDIVVEGCTDPVITVQTSGLYFHPEYNGLNMDHVDTTPIVSGGTTVGLGVPTPGTPLHGARSSYFFPSTPGSTAACTYRNDIRGGVPLVLLALPRLL